MYRPAAHLAYTAGTGDEQHRLRAFIERHRPDAGDEQTAAQLATCARVWEKAGEDEAARAPGPTCGSSDRGPAATQE
ncbi:hypothetical protein [Kitasatospora sp. NPDC017646]|uniref:hypothetical protein n=1 Tax=Kitasatospora sp. NPDC017646 TaxID=3364024 RepID=UPI0037A1CE34